MAEAVEGPGGLRPPVQVGGVASGGTVGIPFLVSSDGTLIVNQTQNTTVLASTARTASPTVADQTNYSGKGLILVIDSTAVSGSSSVVFTIKGYDPASAKYYTILASAAITGTGTTVLRVHPDLTAAANTIAKDILPRTWTITAVHGTADTTTYSVGALIVP